MRPAPQSGYKTTTKITMLPLYKCPYLPHLCSHLKAQQKKKNEKTNKKPTKNPQNNLLRN